MTLLQVFQADWLIPFYLMAAGLFIAIGLYQFGCFVRTKYRLWRCRRYCAQQQREFLAAQERRRAASW